MTATRTTQTTQTTHDGTSGDQSTGTRGKRAVFRIPGTALIGVLMLFMCMFPLAATLPYLLVLLLVPIVLAVWVVRTRTEATEQGLIVRTLRGTRKLAWDSIKGFTITPKSAVVAVLHDDTTVPLPSVRTRHLPVLSLVSDGRVPDPSGLLDQPDDEDESAGGADGHSDEDPADSGKDSAGNPDNGSQNDSGEDDTGRNDK
ncbi:PH domain-containing protein [Saccharomonospora viridis]|uniref:PH domain-containing protein n=1 Tax=Saccharomonospora viridis TaxID=1852 RepID=UPI0024091BAA|nr:PH domain-containing protein [Saccharomonospora viridis]